MFLFSFKALSPTNFDPLLGTPLVWIFFLIVILSLRLRFKIKLKKIEKIQKNTDVNLGNLIILSFYIVDEVTEFNSKWNV